MRILNLVAGEKWTGTAAVVFDQTAALVEAGLEAQFGFVMDSPLARRLGCFGWARPLFERPPRWPEAYLRDVRRLRATILREKFDIIHAHSSHDHWIAALAAPRTPACLVRTIHHVRHARFTGVGRLLLAHTRAFAFANRAIAAAFRSEGPVHSPVMDVQRFRPGPKNLEVLRRFGIPEGKFLIGTIGKMAVGRGQEEAVGAIARLPESVAAVHVGHGERMAWLQSRAAELGVAHRNFWTGYQEEILPDLYRSWDALLFTASGSEQGQRAILEAMASGLPVVALDLPGVRDLMTEGKEGFVVDRVEQLNDRLERLARAPVLCREMGANARQRALEFIAEKFAAKAREFYEKVSGLRT